MAFEHVAQVLMDTNAVKLTVTVSPPKGFSQARLDMLLKDKKGQVLRPMALGARSTVEEWTDVVSRLVQFLVESGFQVVSQNESTTELERSLTAADQMTIEQRLDQIFAVSLPAKMRVLQSADLYQLDFDGKMVNLGNLESKDILTMKEWLKAHGFTKVKEVTEDFRYGEFTIYYERPETEA